MIIENLVKNGLTRLCLVKDLNELIRKISFSTVIFLWTTLFCSEVLSFFNILQIIVINLLIYLLFLSILLILNLKFQNYKINFDYKLFFILIPSILIFISGIIYSPSVYDSFTYHFPRILHWYRNENLNYFFTTISRQNEHPILYDLLTLQIFLLFKNDLFMFIPNFILGHLIILLIIEITIKISAKKINPNLIWFGIFYIPIQIVFMSSTQTDVLTTFLVIYLYYIYIYFENIKHSEIILFLIFSLVLATKTTAFIFTTPIFILILLKFHKRILECIQKYSYILLILVTPVIPFYYRLITNADVVENKVFVDFNSFNLNGVFSNIIRIIFSQLQTPSITLNEKIMNIFNYFYKIFKLEVNPIGFTNFGNFSLSNITHGDFLGNPINLILVFISIIYFTVNKKYLTFTLILVSQIVLFSSTFSWQPWINRFTSTVVIFATILTVLFLNELSAWLKNLIISLVILYASIWIVFNPPRYLFNPNIIKNFLGNYSYDLVKNPNNEIQFNFLNRNKSYFSMFPELEAPYIKTVEILRFADVKEAYLIMKDDQPEYLFWVLSNFNIKFNHLSVDNSENLISNDYVICTIHCKLSDKFKLIYFDNLISISKKS